MRRPSSEDRSVAASAARAGRRPAQGPAARYGRRRAAAVIVLAAATAAVVVIVAGALSGAPGRGRAAASRTRTTAATRPQPPIGPFHVGSVPVQIVEPADAAGPFPLVVFSPGY